MSTCRTCQRPDPTEAVLCTHCAGQISRHLDTIAKLAPAARDTAAGLASRSAGGSGEPPAPLNLAAAARLDAVSAELGTWVRHIADERGHQLPAGDDQIVACAVWLADHTEWMRHREEADEYARDIAACARVIVGVAGTAGERRWLGQCGMPTEAGRCATDLHARLDATTVVCRSCGTRYDVASRRAWLDETVRGHTYTAREISEAYRIAAGTIRSWACRGQLTAAGEYAGQPLYRLGDVLALAERAVQRRAAQAVA